MRFPNGVWWLLLLASWSRVEGADAHDPATFEPAIREFETADRQTPPTAHPVLFVGSSSFRLWTNLGAAFPQWPVLNRGFGGSTMADLLYFQDRLVRAYQPRIIAVYEGDNDLAAGTPVAEVLRQFGEFLDRVKRDSPGTPVVLLAVKPSPSRLHLLAAQRELNAGLLRFASERPQVLFADVFTPILSAGGEPDPRWFKEDRLHLNADGYARWVPVIAKALTQADAMVPRKPVP